MQHAANLAAAAAIFVVLQVLISHFYLHIPVTLAGERMRVDRDITISELLKEKRMHLKSGNLLNVRGAIIHTGKGKPAYVTIDDSRVGFSTVVRAGNVIAPQNGEDVVEPVVTRRVPIPPETKVVGSGKYLAVNAAGRAGVRLDHLGALSKIVTKREVLRRPIPTVLLRTNKAPPKMVALTFDDGPWGSQTLRIVATLNKYQVPATFFVMGQQAEKYPAVLRKQVQEGFVIGNHTYDHPNLTHLSHADARDELEWTQRIVMRIAHRRTYWMRPPGGNTNSEVEAITKSLDMRSVMWDLDSHDWTKPGTKAIVRTVLSEIRPAYIVLMHDGGGDRGETLQSLPYIIRGLRQKGYTFVTLDDLFNIPMSKSRLPVKTPKRVATSSTSTGTAR